jgi:hypothetical protein
MGSLHTVSACRLVLTLERNRRCAHGGSRRIVEAVALPASGEMLELPPTTHAAAWYSLSEASVTRNFADTTSHRLDSSSSIGAILRAL